MKSHVQVAVIGGGVVGASVLYHLAKAGWTDVVLIERDELTSGSTWHAAGGMHTLNGDPNVAKLQKYTIELYKEIEEASGQSCSIHITAGVDLAGTPERMDFLKLACARARYLGLGMEIISDRRGRAHLSADGQAAFRRGAVQPARRPRRSLGRHPCVREGGAQSRRRGLSLHARHQSRAATRRLVERAHRQGRSRRRARRQCGGPVGARSRPLRRPRIADPRDGAPIHRHRRDSGSRGFAEGSPARDRLRGRDLHAPGRQGHADRHLREGRRAVGRAADAVEFHARAPAARSRSHRRQPRGRLPPFPPAGARRHQARSSTGRSRSRRTAIRSSVRSAGSAITGSRAA